MRDGLSLNKRVKIKQKKKNSKHYTKVNNKKRKKNIKMIEKEIDDKFDLFKKPYQFLDKNNEINVKNENVSEKSETSIDSNKDFDLKDELKNNINEEYLLDQILSEQTEYIGDTKEQERIKLEDKDNDRLRYKDRDEKISLTEKIGLLKDSLKNQKLSGKTVYLEDTGEKLGIISDTINDNKGKLLGLKIKTNEKKLTWFNKYDLDNSGELSFPVNQFYLDKRGIIFLPSWYINAKKSIDEIELYEKTSPDFFNLVTDNGFDEELYILLTKQDDKFAEYVKESISLRKLFNSQIKLISDHRKKLIDELSDIMKKRLIEEIDRRKFSEIVSKTRRKVNILDLNIGKCKKLLNRLDKTSFGKITKNINYQFKNKDTQKLKSNYKLMNEDKKSNNLDYNDNNPPLTEIIAYFLEEKIIEDIKNQLIKNQFISDDKSDVYDRIQKTLKKELEKIEEGNLESNNID